MSKPLFDCVLIARNESATLPRLVASLKEFQERGGKIYMCDTGSTDNTPEIARSLGCEVTEVGDRFRVFLTDEQVKEINEKFIVEGEEPIVKIGDSLFDYASARNFAATLSEQDMIATPDCDEVYEKLDIDKLNEGIKNGVSQYEYNFVFAHDQFGNETVKFRHSKFYNKKVLTWTGIIHEVLSGEAERSYVGEDVVKLAHWQNHSTDRTSYPKGLALDRLLHPDNDRHAFYFSRDLMYCGRDKSAIAGFKNHIAMNRWPLERAQSMVFIGDLVLKQGKVEEALDWWWKAWNVAPTRRIALLRLARYYDQKGERIKVACLINAVLQIPESGFYGEQMDEYRDEPYHLLAWAYKYLGREKEAQEQFLIAFKYKPLDERYRRNAAHFGGLQACLKAIGVDTKFTGERLIPEECIPDLVTEHKARYEFAKKFVEGHSVLDAACGEGYGKEIMKASSYLGFDVDAKTIREADTKYGNNKAHFILTDLEQGFFIPEETIVRPEFIVSFETIEHLEDPTKFLEDVAYHTDTFIFSIPVSMPSEFHKQVYTQAEIKELIGKYFKYVIWYGQTGGEIGELKDDSVYVVGIASNNLPKVSILVPSLRPEGLQKLRDSIDKLNYPKELIETLTIENRPDLTAPVKVDMMWKDCTGDVAIFAADDTEFTPDCVIHAVLESKDYGLVGFNTGPVYPSGGNRNEHYLIRRDLVERLEDQQIFHTDFKHYACDTWLVVQAEMLGEFHRSENAVMIHNHFTKTGKPHDDVTKLALSSINEDRATLDAKLTKHGVDRTKYQCE